MTNSEAIEVLKANYPDPCYDSLRVAVDTAIFALSEESLNIELAYLRGINDGIERCTERIRKVNDEVRRRFEGVQE